MNCTRRRGVAVMDLAVGLACAGLLVAVALPALRHARDAQATKDCAKNLSAIAMALCIYGNENADTFPTVLPPAKPGDYDASLKPELYKVSREDAPHIYYAEKKAALPGNPAACLWILVLKAQVAPKNFVCPADPVKPVAAPLSKDADAAFYSTFSGEKSLSYSLAYPWGFTQDGAGRSKGFAGAWWKNMTDSSLPIMADMAPLADPKATPARNPAAADGAPKARNSANHDFEGQNVAYGDAHVSFEKRPDCGQNSDNIWSLTVDGKAKNIPGGSLGGTIQTNAAPFDVVMVPARATDGTVK